MISLLVITHESVGEAYQGLARHFFAGGLPDYVQILGVQPDEDQDDIINRAIASLQDFPPNHGVLIMTDIFGATPCNAARRMVRENKSAILTGLNAPMMIKAMQYAPQAEDLQAFTETVREAAVKGIFAITARPDDLQCC
ncbi:PTS mannose transporter subunit IIA [Neisseria sp. ZJ106]|uniref:PTS mannose transporter subunit IIA n=1 Tax=Neisseria lisongii TaxID=2912188 RepID=A0AAW5AKX1_9NEIS|nr:PTS mannose transporter subunit IIA [Neisseria lisongii]MCF7522201.1 PTS mannose transporter subunit IIA [Neisseria lisongii]MCF7530512.1 PTS mannose transporter subunit IIA [Neisseria lisongii]WCL71622.1 PTS mannose transporter subunit IIA [Neisseria lisongii]